MQSRSSEAGGWRGKAGCPPGRRVAFLLMRAHAFLEARTLLSVCLIVAGVSLASLEATEGEEAAEAAGEGVAFGGESGAGGDLS